MIKISKIEFNSFFGEKNISWTLNPDVNILGGKNGGGKSTLFRMCFTLLTQEHINEDDDKYFSSIAKRLTITFSNDWSLSWECADKSSDYTVDLGGEKMTVFREDAIEIRDNDGKNRKISELHKQLNVFMLNSFEQYVEKAVQYEKTPKRKALDNPTMLDLMIKEQIDLRNKDFAEMMEQFVDDSDNDIAARSEYLKKYRLIYSALSIFLDQYEDEFSSKFEFSRNGKKFGYEYLSTGEKQILLLLLMVSNTKQEPCIFFMDEPDLSMHIDWKEKLVTELNKLNPNMQIILSTHAPSVITGWMDCVVEIDQLAK